MPAPRRNPSVVALCLILLLVTGLGLTAILHSQVQPVGSGTLGPLVADTLCLDLTNQDVCLSRASANILELAAGDSLNLNPAGVRLSSDGDGAITFLGLGEGSDENLTINLDDTATAAVVTSSTGLNTVSLSGLGVSLDGAVLVGDAANVLALRNGTNLQTFRLAETFTDQANYSRFFITATGSTFDFGSEAAGSGTVRTVRLLVGNSLGFVQNTALEDAFYGRVGIGTALSALGQLSRAGANASQFYENTRTEAHTLAAAATSDTTIT